MEEVEIRVRGQVDIGWSDWLGGLQMGHTEDGDTILTGVVRDQSALQGLLLRLVGLNLSLVSLTVRQQPRHDNVRAGDKH